MGTAVPFLQLPPTRQSALGVGLGPGKRAHGFWPGVPWGSVTLCPLCARPRHLLQDPSTLTFLRSLSPWSLLCAEGANISVNRAVKSMQNSVLQGFLAMPES